MVFNRSKKDKRFAPSYQHKDLKDMATGFKGIFLEAVDGVVDQVTEGVIKLGTGSAKTLYGDNEGDIRFDRQRCLSGRHPSDNFVNYQLQANMQAKNKVLAGLAAHGNGTHRAQGGLGGSTLASVNVQTLREGQRRISPPRLGHALGHSNRYAEPIWLLDRQSNVDTVPASRRQRNAVYHTNPYTGYTDDATNDPNSPFYGIHKGNGLLSTPESRFFRPPKGGYTDNFPTNGLGRGDRCPHCGTENNRGRRICWKCNREI